MSGASRVDDTPMAHHAFGFPFVFGGTRHRHAWANANGALFFTPTPPCDAYVFLKGGAWS